MSIDLGIVRLPDGQAAHLRLDAGRIAALDPVRAVPEALILPLPVDPHLHLDKTYTITRCKPGAPGLFGAIEAMQADMPNWTGADLRARITRALEEAEAMGLRALRSHVDWNTPEAPGAWSLLGEMGAEWEGRLVLQRAALVPLDLLGDPDLGPGIAARVARDGGVLGAFVYRNEDLPAKLARVFDLAARHDLRLDFHVDEGLEAEARGLDEIAALTHSHDMQGRVLCGHACSLSILPEDALARSLARMAEAGIALTVLPTTNLHLQDTRPGRSPRLRGLAPMHEMRAAGIALALGADNVRDPFYPYGSYAPLDVYRIAVLAAHLDPGAWLDTITTPPAAAMGLEPAALMPGAPADFLLIPARDWAEAISPPSVARRIFRGGVEQLPQGVLQ